MPKVLLALGPIIFRDFELPPEISFGGRQRLAIHRLADGRRVIDCLGRDDADVRFSGVLAGPDAASRAQALDELRSSGAVLPLTWDRFYYSVLVAEFSAQYQNDTWIPYSLKCAVLYDESESLPLVAASLAQLLADDVNAAAFGATAADIDFSSATSAISAPGATVYGSAGFQAAQQSLGSMKANLATRIWQAEQQLSGIDLSLGSAVTATATLCASTTTQQLAWLTRAHGYIGRAVANLASQGGPL